MESVQQAVARQLILYDSDAVQADFTDGSRVLLSSCGSQFVHQYYHQCHALQGPRCVQQKTRFSTSDYRHKVITAVEFRNRFAERPYICSELLDSQSIVVLFSDLHSVKWPSKWSWEYCQVLSNGQLQVRSKEGHACLTLAPHQQDFSVQFLAKLSSDSKRKAVKHPLLDLNKDFDSMNRSHYGRSNSKTLKSNGKDYVNSDHRYTHIIQHHSIHSYPDCWSHPLSLVLNFSLNYVDLAINLQAEADLRSESYHNSKFKHSGENVSNDKHLDEENGSIVCAEKEDTVCSVIPRTLPLSCSNIHLHKEALSQHILLEEHESVSNITETCRLEGLKVVCSSGVIYRFVDGCGVEILPGDGSIIKSTTSAGGYYVHHKVEPRAAYPATVLERTYSVKNPPPDIKDLNYSVTKLIFRADRFLQVVTSERLLLSTVNVQICWKSPEKRVAQQPASGAILLEEMSVPRVGHFRAYSSGRMTVLFEDRTRLQMFHDFRPRLAREGLVEEEAENRLQFRTDSREMCRLLLPNGKYVTAAKDQAGCFECYVDIAREWGDWVNTPSGERRDFYSKRSKMPSAEAELLKIRTFNYLSDRMIVGRGTSPTIEPHCSSVLYAHSKTEYPVDVESIQKALRQSSHWLEETDKLLQKSSANLTT